MERNVNSDGSNIRPERPQGPLTDLERSEVEAVIYTHPAVREVAVFGIPDPKWGEIVKAVVVLKPGKTLTADELIAYCRRSLANFKVPRNIQISDKELPKSGSGKILKRLLRDTAWSCQERAVA
jgi:acyl-CoA synthetase (AMP-forming)/AMP-acid ligase II